MFANVAIFFSNRPLLEYCWDADQVARVYGCWLSSSHSGSHCWPIVINTDPRQPGGRWVKSCPVNWWSKRCCLESTCFLCPKKSHDDFETFTALLMLAVSCAVTDQSAAAFVKSETMSQCKSIHVFLTISVSASVPVCFLFYWFKVLVWWAMQPVTVTGVVIWQELLI